MLFVSILGRFCIFYGSLRIIRLRAVTYLQIPDKGSVHAQSMWNSYKSITSIDLIPFAFILTTSSKTFI